MRVTAEVYAKANDNAARLYVAPDFSYLFYCVKLKEHVLELVRISTIWKFALFLVLNRPCGPLENAPRVKFGSRARVCGPPVYSQFLQVTQ